MKIGWSVSKFDECLFYRTGLIITIYVDDINIFGINDTKIANFKEEIANVFQMTDAGPVSWYLGMQVQRTASRVRIHQANFVNQVLSRYGLQGIKPKQIPLDPLKKLKKESATMADAKFKYRFMSITGSLNYLQTKTRFDLAFPVSLISRYMANPNQEHMDAALSQCVYIAGQPDTGLHYRKSGSKKIDFFVDSDYSQCPDTARSTTGWVGTLAGCPITWSSQRQKMVTTSSIEAEYVAASDVCKEAVWILGLYNEISS